jgi:hypothetical protein
MILEIQPRDGSHKCKFSSTPRVSIQASVLDVIMFEGKSSDVDICLYFQ